MNRAEWNWLKMSKIKIIGDVHGKHLMYKNVIKDVDYSIQIGDFGFRNSWNWLNANISPDNHKILPGNHEEYTHITSHSLGDYGMYDLAGMKFFFVRGAFSVDKLHRRENVSWWAKEELELNELLDAANIYEKEKPDIMLTHDCPGNVYGVSWDLFKRAWIPNRTSQVLQEMFERHQPKLWIFGHWHMNVAAYIKSTFFICLDELDSVYYDTEKDVDWNVVDMNDYLKRKNKKDFYW